MTPTITHGGEQTYVLRGLHPHPLLKRELKRKCCVRSAGCQTWSLDSSGTGAAGATSAIQTTSFSSSMPDCDFNVCVHCFGMHADKDIGRHLETWRGSFRSFESEFPNLSF